MEIGIICNRHTTSHVTVMIIIKDDSAFFQDLAM